MTSPERVLIVEDHLVTRQGIRTLLGAIDDVEVVGEVTSGDEAIAAVASLRPSAVFMDVTLPGIDGIEATRRIKQRWPATKVIMLSADEDGDVVTEAVRAGATAYLAKSSTLSDLERALRTEDDEGVYMSPSIASRLVRDASRPTTEERPTDREIEVLRLVARGLTARSIATRLSVSERTVDTHISHLYRRLNVNNRVDVVLEGIRRGLVDAPVVSDHAKQASGSASKVARSQ